MRATRPTAKVGAADPRLAGQKSTIEGFERLHVQVTKSQYEQLKHMAFDERVSLAEVVRSVLKDGLAAKRSK
jgi:DNA polymerase II large subunit